MFTAELWYWSGPPLPSSGLALDEELVTEQIHRAETLPDVDVLVIGDSAALFAVDTSLLGHLMDGCRAESLATIGFVGPVGYAGILQRFFGRGRTASTLLVLVHGLTLQREPGWAGWEQFIRDGGPSRRPGLVGARDKILHDVIYRVIFYPLKGAYGAYYGSAAQFRAFVSQSSGSGIAPSHGRGPTDFGSGVYLFASSQLWREGLSALADVVRAARLKRVFIALAPIPSSWYAAPSEETRSAMLDEVQATLKLSDSTRLPLPPAMDGTDFANSFYLNEIGREHYTHALADVLSDSSCVGDSPARSPTPE